MSELLKYLPGRLGNPDSLLNVDKRLDPRILAVYAAAGMDGPAEASPVTSASSYEECLAHCLEMESNSAMVNMLMAANMPDFPTVDSTTEIIKGVDDNEITLYLHRPKNVSGPIPCIVHTHGGGMVILKATDPNFVMWRNSIAAKGAMVVGVEFRNGGGELGNHPFPAGLNDCCSAINWVTARKSEFGISSVVVSGESGGGNLCISTALKAKKEGWLSEISGIYAMCPYISGAYANPPNELLSLKENDQYMLDVSMMGALAKVYDPDGQNTLNPLAWPLCAEASDLEGLPPHIISVNELDPLRDEGLAYYRKLVAAGVSAVGRTVHGTPHAADMAFPEQVPEVFESTLRDLVGFAESLA
jgi:acetyl esterase